MGSGSSRMGSGSSRMGSTTTRPTSQRRFSSFICGSSSSSQMEDYAPDSPLITSRNSPQLTNKLSSHGNESALSSKGGTGFTSRSSPTSQPGASSEISISSSDHTSCEDESQVESFIDSRCLPHNGQVVPTHVDSLPMTDESCKDQILPVQFHSKRLAAAGIQDPFDTDMSQPGLEATSTIPSSGPHDELERVSASFEGNNEVLEIHGSDNNGRISVASDPLAAMYSQNDEAIEEVQPSGLGLLVPDRVQARPDGSLLHVDVVSISSNNFPNINDDISIHEARRNSRRMFWDAFSSRASRRHTDFPTVLFTSEDADLMGSRRRWILDVGDGLLDDGVDVESWHYSRRNRSTSERRQNSRSEFWDRLRGAASQSTRRTTCPYDLHSDGSCSCDLDEEASFLTSISRIVLLAEALFEVLDEIHRQPDSFSLSMLSIPAPESVVDALPIRTYEKPNSAEADHGDDVDQCYICLIEYEEGDKIRVLPCHHEYHMSCVDRWLKEVHGVCPLCRGDVRGDAVRDDTASSSSDAHLSHA